MGKLKNENYFVVQGWMLNELKLKGIELMLYAIIWGFTQEVNTFTGSLSYLEEFTGATRPTVIEGLKRLCEKRLLEKCVVNTEKGKVCIYKAVKNLDYPSKETLPPLVKNLDYPSKETLPNNIYNNISNNINNNESGSPTNTDYEFITKDGIYTLSITDYEYFKKGYKNIDVDKELEKMVMWCYSNDKKRKTKRGMKTFINSWLSRVVPVPSPIENSNILGNRTTSHDEEMIDKLLDKEVGGFLPKYED